MNCDLLQWGLKLTISGLLVYAAVEDVRRREVPYVAGMGLLLFGAFALTWDQRWLLVAFYLSAVIGSKGGVWGLLPAAIGLSALAVPGLREEAYPFIMAIFFVNVMFRLGAIGEGDAVLAYGLLAMAYESRLWMPLVLLGTSVLGIIPIFWKRSLKEVISRVGDMFQHFGQIEEDGEAVLFPWAVIGAGIGLVYIWLVAGEIL